MTNRPPSDDKAAAGLEGYDPSAYPPVAVTVDVVLLTVRSGRLSVLLVKRGSAPYEGEWALPGGFVQPDEDLDAAARRELVEETGIAAPDVYLEQLRTYGSPDRDPRMRVVSVAYLGLTADLPSPVAGSDAASARFWPVDDLGTAEGPELAFDHALILGDGVERARAKLEYSTLAAAFVEEPFTIADLRRVYEAVWGVQLHAANFRRKVLSVPGFVVATGHDRPTGRAPAELYTRGPAASLTTPILRPTPSPRPKSPQPKSARRKGATR